MRICSTVPFVCLLSVFEIPRLWALPERGRESATAAGKCCHSPGSKLFLSVLCRDNVEGALLSIRALRYTFRLW